MQRSGLLKALAVLSCLAATLAAVSSSPAAEDVLPGVKRVLFLGDSITYDGKYVAYVETELLVRCPQRSWEIVNCGLPSETVSGLSEDGHAGGKFPRPDLHERLDRVLDRIKPDLVLACYGMNDGIYLPPSDERFQRFQDGMRRLRQKVEACGAKIVHLTPPVFDPLPIRAKLPCSIRCRFAPSWSRRTKSLPARCTSATARCWTGTPTGCWPSATEAGR